MVITYVVLPHFYFGPILKVQRGKVTFMALDNHEVTLKYHSCNLEVSFLALDNLQNGTQISKRRKYVPKATTSLEIHKYYESCFKWFMTCMNYYQCLCFNVREKYFNDTKIMFCYKKQLDISYSLFVSLFLYSKLYL